MREGVRTLSQRLRSIFLGAALLSLLPAFSDTAIACASCGSGGDDPLILYPNQQWRFYLGASRSFGFKTVKANGDAGDENAPAQKDSLTLAIGRAISQTAFVTFTVPYLQNSRGDESQRAFGDPLLAGRWTVIQQDFANPFLPQTQLVAAHRFAQARSQQEGTDPSRLDVFGQGVSETKLGVDVFHGLNALKWGFAYVFLFPEERNLGGKDIYIGLGQRGLVTLGYGISGMGKAQAGYTRNLRSNKKIDGQEIPSSDVIENGAFLTVDAEINDSDVIRLTWAEKFAGLDSKLGSKNSSVTLAVIWGLSE
jgi:hypothetical protein